MRHLVAVVGNFHFEDSVHFFQSPINVIVCPLTVKMAATGFMMKWTKVISYFRFLDFCPILLP